MRVEDIEVATVPGAGTVVAWKTHHKSLGTFNYEGEVQRVFPAPVAIVRDSRGVDHFVLIEGLERADERESFEYWKTRALEREKR